MILQQSLLDFGIRTNRKHSAPDEGVILESKTDELVESTYQRYCQLSLIKFLYLHDDYKTIHESPIMKYDYALNPCQIDILAARMAKHATHNRIGSFEPFFLSAMIQRSYNSGLYDRFTITTDDDFRNYIGQDIRGTQERRLGLIINGAAGIGCVDKASYIDLEVNGFVGGHFGTELWQSKIRLNGIGNYNGHMAKFAEGCEFRVVDTDTYYYLTMYAPRSNQVILIDKAGNKLEERILRGQTR